MKIKKNLSEIALHLFLKDQLTEEQISILQEISSRWSAARLQYFLAVTLPRNYGYHCDTLSKYLGVPLLPSLYHGFPNVVNPYAVCHTFVARIRCVNLYQLDPLRYTGDEGFYRNFFLVDRPADPDAHQLVNESYIRDIPYWAGTVPNNLSETTKSEVLPPDQPDRAVYQVEFTIDYRKHRLHADIEWKEEEQYYLSFKECSDSKRPSRQLAQEMMVLADDTVMTSACNFRYVIDSIAVVNKDGSLGPVYRTKIASPAPPEAKIVS